MRKSIAERLRARAGAGLENVTILDTSPFLQDVDWRESRWFEAFDAIEKRGQYEPLARLIESNQMSLAVALCLADWIRRRLNPNPGKRPTPLYDLPRREKLLHLAVAEFRDLRALGTSRNVALRAAAKQFDIDDGVLADRVDGKRSSSRRLAQSRKAFLDALRANATLSPMSRASKERTNGTAT